MCGWIAVVELEGVRPAREVRIAAEGQHLVTPCVVDTRVVVRFARQIGRGPGHVVLRVIGHPGMIGSGMVRHEVEHQPQPAAAKPFADSCQRFVPTQCFMHRVSGDREPRAGDIVVSQIVQRLLEFVAPLGIRARDLLRDRPRLPDAQEPDPVEPHPGDAVELCVGNVIECGFPAQAARQVGQPDAGVDLVQRGVTRCCHVSALGPASAAGIHRRLDLGRRPQLADFLDLLRRRGGKTGAQLRPEELPPGSGMIAGCGVAELRKAA